MWMEYLTLALLTLMCVILKIEKKSTILNSGGQNWTNNKSCVYIVNTMMYLNPDFRRIKKKLFWIMKYGPPQLYGW